MPILSEQLACYAAPQQREILLALLNNRDLEGGFFLTGGTALSVFYLHHRVSEDLDFFTRQPAPLGDIGFWIRQHWGAECMPVKEEAMYLSYLLRDIRVDCVVDPLSLDETRPRYAFENGKTLAVDSIPSIASNKFCTVVSRTEPKDFIDFYMLLHDFPDIRLEDVYQTSRRKDAVFDDPPTAAFQIECGVAFLREHPSLGPRMVRTYDPDDFFRFYQKVVHWLYGQVNV